MKSWKVTIYVETDDDVIEQDLIKSVKSADIIWQGQVIVEQQ